MITFAYKDFCSRLLGISEWSPPQNPKHFGDLYNYNVCVLAKQPINYLNVANNRWKVRLKPTSIYNIYKLKFRFTFRLFFIYLTVTKICWFVNKNCVCVCVRPSRIYGNVDKQITQAKFNDEAWKELIGIAFDQNKRNVGSAVGHVETVNRNDRRRNTV